MSCCIEGSPIECTYLLYDRSIWIQKAHLSASCLSDSLLDVLQYRFNSYWLELGFPAALKPEDSPTDLHHVLIKLFPGPVKAASVGLRKNHGGLAPKAVDGR